MRTAIAALLLMALSACQPVGRIDTGTPPRLAAGQSAQLSVIGRSDATATLAAPLREALTQRLTERLVFRQVATDATPTDLIVNVDILDAVALENGRSLGGLTHRAEIRAEVEIIDAARAVSLGRFVVTGRSAAGLAGGSTADALAALVEEIAAALADGRVAAVP